MKEGESGVVRKYPFGGNMRSSHIYDNGIEWS